MIDGVDPTPYELDQVMRNAMLASGISKEIVDGFLMTDSDLDKLCENVLSGFAIFKHSRTNREIENHPPRADKA